MCLAGAGTGPRGNYPQVSSSLTVNSSQEHGGVDRADTCGPGHNGDETHIAPVNARLEVILGPHMPPHCDCFLWTTTNICE